MTLAVPPAAQIEVTAQVTAIMLQRVEGAEGLTDVLKDERLNALCLGPGNGHRACAGFGAGSSLKTKRATVLDADALTAFADDPSAAFILSTPRKLRSDASWRRVLAAVPGYRREAGGQPQPKARPIQKWTQRVRPQNGQGCVVLFKGPDTVIAAPDGRCSINARRCMTARLRGWRLQVLAMCWRGSSPVYWRAGSSPKQAAETGAWLHVECARTFGPGLIAEDLPEQLPKVFKELNI